MPRATTTTNVPAKANVTALADIRAQLAAEVANIQDQIGKPSGNKIKIKDKTFGFPDGSLDEGPISLTVIDFVSRNKYYTGKFDPKNPAPPECFAVGKNLKEMRPSSNAPHPQASSCHECPNNQFGSDGRGKACKNTRYLAVLAPDETNPAAEIMTLEVSPTGIQKFDAWVNSVAKLHRKAPVEVSVDVEFDARYDYDTLVFSNARELPDEAVAAHFARRAEAETILMAEPDFAAAVPAKPAARRAPTRKAA